MRKENNLITTASETYETVTGRIPYNLMNDYMFKATLQESKEALTGLISALLMVAPETLEVEVTNPIVLGRNALSKSFYLDVKVIVNNEKYMNLEMQVLNEENWPERSVSYTSRLFDSLYRGENYKDAMSVHHVGFINFNLNETNNKFYDTFKLKSVSNAKIYTDKFIISVVNLMHIGDATEKDCSYKLDRWAKLITATTWDELKDVAKGDPYMEATARELFELSKDFDVLEEARRREEYYAAIESRDIALAEKDAALAEKDAALAEKDVEIASITAEKNSVIAENIALKKELEKYLSSK